MTEQITLYTAKVCPYAARAQVALRESGAKFQEFEIDLQDKPTWYQPKVNPLSKVPAVTYGGPNVRPDEPSPESVKLRESLAIIDWVADAFPDAKLLPKDPLTRYKIRLFIEVITSTFIPAYTGFIFKGEPVETLIKALETVQGLLPDNTKYAVSDEFTNADIAAAPFLARLEMVLRNDVGVYASGEGKKFYETLSKDAKYTKLWKYIRAIKERPSFNEIFLEDYLLERAKRRAESAKANL